MFLKYQILCMIILCQTSRYCKCIKVNLFIKKPVYKFYCAPPFYRGDSVTAKQAIFFLADIYNAETLLQDCLLTKRSAGITTMLLREHTYLTPKLFKEFPSKNPFIVIVTQHLNMAIIYHSITRNILISNRSIVYIVITTKDPAYGCVNGVFEKNVFNTLDELLNRIWHEYKTFVVVVEFPYVCPKFFVVFKDKRKSERVVYDRTITTIPADGPESEIRLRNSGLKNDLTEGYPLRANIFNRFPTSTVDCRNAHFYLKVDPKYTNGLCGMDAFIMHDILQHYKFDTTFPKVSDKDGYGYAYNSNNATGSLGQLLKKEFDISFNSRFMVQYLESDVLNFLHYVSFDSVCAVLKTPDYLPLWYYSFYFLNPKTWGVLASLMILCSVTNKMSIMIRKSMGKKTDSSNIIDLIFIGMSGWYYNKRLKASLLGGICLLTPVIFCACFQGHVNYVYTALIRNDRIRSLAGLHNSNFRIYASTSFYNVLGPDIQSQGRILKVNKDTGDVLKESNIATLQRKSDVILEIRRDFCDDEGWPLIYIVQECYCHYFLSYISRKDFPFGVEIKVYVMRLLESGLPDAYYQFTQNALQLAYTGSFYKPKSKPRPFTPTNMPELRVAFSFLCIGYFFSTVALVIEIWREKRSKRKMITFLL